MSKCSLENRCGLNPRRLAGARRPLWAAGVRRPLVSVHGPVLDPGFPDAGGSGFNTIILNHPYCKHHFPIFSPFYTIIVMRHTEAAVFFQHYPRITQELAIFEPFLFFHVLHIKTNSDYR